ncbi:Hypothetical predicted protein [Cloeon dipterum]|uniref:Mothers against decapentaplegic homolog n=1 Tax=Cloeon dipterum TaxID=197152 RepID=A0A8S1BY09_9INSE|nr:Hypothetical predicted protein [Cloeon dipterum]
MFRRKREPLTQRLLKAVREKAAAADAAAVDAASLHAHVLQQLSEQHLELLLLAVERDGARTCCVPARRGATTSVDATSSTYCCCATPDDDESPPASGASRTAEEQPYQSPHVLCCQAFRWPELQDTTQLKRLPQCTTLGCCNPFHYSKVCGPESPPPPYRRYPYEKLRPEDRAPSEESLKTNKFSYTTSPNCSSISNFSLRSSFSTNGEGTEQTDEWCKLAYWEQQHRVGDLFSVRSPSVHVFGGPAKPGMVSAALCLTDLVPKYPGVPIEPSPPIKKTRSKIADGVLISQEGDTVWAYNLSECPMFVNSPTLDDLHSRSLVVYKLPPGYCQRIFSWERAELRRKVNARSENTLGPENTYSVRISFAKGWGPKYARQEITVCHCWLEVLLTRPAR